MFTIAKINPEQNYIYTNDHDLLQVCDDHNVVVKSFHSKLYEWTKEKVEETYGVPPYLLAVLFAFTGDKVDNIEGVSRINKKYLVQLINWAYNEKLDPDQTQEEIRTADWSPKMREQITEFINSDQFMINYELIKLKLVPKISPQRVVRDDDFIKKCLLHWNIRTLRLCAGYDLIDNAEF